MENQLDTSDIKILEEAAIKLQDVYDRLKIILNRSINSN